MISINILMIIFIALLIGIGSYLLRHQKRDFLIFHPTRDSLLSSVIRTFGIVFTSIGIITTIIMFTQDTILICIALVLGCIAVTAFYLCISKFIN